MNNLIRYGSLALVPFLAVALAKGSRGAGRHVALAKLTNIDSVEETIDGQVRPAGKLGLLALAFVVAVVVLFFFAPSGSGSAVQFIASMISFCANLLLGLAAGISLNASGILAKVSERDTIKANIDMKRRTRRRLTKIVSVLVLAFLLATGVPVHAETAGRVWAWVIDVTDSVDPAQREAAIAAMIQSALEVARKLGTDRIVVVKVGDEDFLSDMSWVSVPPIHTFVDCRKVDPPITISKSWLTWSPTSLREAKAAAVRACEDRQKAERSTVAEEEARFTEQLQRATWLVPRADVTTRIVPLVQTLVARPYVGAIDLVTDLQDRSGTPPEHLDVPDGISVTIIVTRPNPGRPTPTLREVVASAERWAKITGITVISAAEYPGYVHAAGRSR
jgi:hypothetical protein